MSSRIIVTAILLALSLSGCSIFDKKKVPLEGERVSVFAGRSELEPDKDMQNVTVTLPAPVVNDSWPESGGYPNYAMQHLAVGAAPQVVWTANIGKGSTSSRILTTPPVIADGKVFTKDAESTVSAFDAETGKVLWTVTLKPEKTRDADEFGGGLVWYGGRLFVTTGFAVVFSLNPATGEEYWHSSVSAPVRGAPLVFADRVFATSIDNKLHAMAASDGADLWSFSGLSEVAGYVGGNSPAGASDYVVAPFSSGELVCLRLDNGRVVWNESLVGSARGELRAFGNLADIRGRPVIDRGLVYAMGSAGQISAFDLLSGQRKWDRPIGGNQTPWVAGNFVYVVTGSADVAALSRDNGMVKWSTPLTQYADAKRTKPVLWGGPVLAGDRLLVGGTTGELIALSPYNGEILGKVDMKGPVRLAPVVANRTIYVLTDNGELVVLR